MIEQFSSPLLRELLPRYRAFIEAELMPQEMRLLSIPFREAAIELNRLREKAKETGLWAPFMSPTDGTQGLTLPEFAQLSEWMARTPFGHYVFNCQAPDIGNMELLHRHASEYQRDTYLIPLEAGHIRSCFSMTEPGQAGSNPLQMDTTAVEDGDEWVINGRKWFTTAADGAQFAVVMAITEPEASTHERASLIIVPTDTPGFKLVRNIPVMGEAGEGYHSHGEIQYTDCRVPKRNLIGARGSGFKLAQERLGPGRIHHCMRWIGIAERALELMCQRAVSRSLGRDRLSDRDTVRHWIAESRASIDAARYFVLHVAHDIETKGAKASRDGISAIKFHVAKVMLDVLDKAIQVHGALGLTEDTPLSYWYRHERGARIYDGPDEVHKSSLARSILKKYETGT
jgi:alkylation response protein AidB-like acyl-CoA dehydrogenase